MYLLAILPWRECEILKMRLGLNMSAHTAKEVGIHFGISGNRIRQLEARARDRICNYLLKQEGIENMSKKEIRNLVFILEALKSDLKSSPRSLHKTQ